MVYEVINEDLKIASCSIADLTMDQAQRFLKQWEPGANLGSLTLFFERETGLIVLNRDNKNFQLYKDITEGFLGLNEAERE